MKPEFRILTGPVHTGKSTALQHWIDRQRSQGAVVRGLLNPVIDRRKWFMDAHSGNTFPMEAGEGEKVISVGRYNYSTAAFDRAQDLIGRQSLLPADIFVLDEIGKLELRGEGLEPAVSQFMQASDAAICAHVILVVRDFLVKPAIEKYGLEGAKIIEKEGLID